MDIYDEMQESEVEVFGMDDWGVGKKDGYVHSYDIDSVLKFINASDMQASTSPMQYSTSTPMVPLSFSSNWAASPLNDFYGHSAPETCNLPQDRMDYLSPTWAVPTLQNSSYGSSIGTEPSFNGFANELHMQRAISPSPDFDIPSFVRSPNDSRHWFDENSVARAESNASFDTINEEQSEPMERFSLSPKPPESSGLAVVHYQAKGRTKRQTPETGLGKRSRGRKGPLNPQNRISTANMRNVGACKACRDRKIKCDKGLPCRACINFYKCRLIHNPCRGRQLATIADEILLCGNIFPKDHGLFGSNLHKDTSTFIVYLEVGFGKAFPWKAQLLSPLGHGNIFPTELRHSHVVYPWRISPMTRQNERAQRIQQDHWVFPALLVDTSPNLVAAVDTHIGALLDDPASFQSFPLYRSPLQVLKTIYLYYKHSLDLKSKQLLRQVLKLLITIHICGEIKISPSEDSQAIIDTHFPNVHHSEVTPCFIRSQLGPVFKEIASKLMKDVLTSLELHCLDKNCVHFPLVICTFAVLFMSVESIHYHAARDSYHVNHTVGHRDCSSALANATPEAFENSTGVKELLAFYRACFSKCHSERLSGTAETSPVPVVESLRRAVESARAYLEQRSQDSVVAEGDITIFFDRLLAKLFLLQEPE